MPQKQTQNTTFPAIQAFQEQRGAGEPLISLPLQQPADDEYAAIVAAIDQLSGEWNPVMLYTASTDSREREERWFMEALDCGRSIEPHFEYPFAQSFPVAEARRTLDALEQRVRALRPTNEIQRLTAVALTLKLLDDRATCDLAEGLQRDDDALVQRGLTRKYPGTDPLLVREAYARYARECTPRPATHGSLSENDRTRIRAMRFDAQGVKEAYEWALARYGILAPQHPRGFRVIIDPDVTAVDVRDKYDGGPTVAIPADESQDGEELLALIAHEIEAHARQAMNGLELFRIGTILRTDDETMYEGLAIRQEDAFVQRHFGEAASPESPLYVLAIALAEQGKSFSQIFHDQEAKWLHVYGTIPADEPLPERSMIDPAIRAKARRRAWRTTYRVMRGHTDMRNTAGFAMAKDLAYLRGKLLDDMLCRIGLGSVNESAIISMNGLPLLSRFDIREQDLPYPYLDVASEYLGKLLQGHHS